MRSLSLGRLAAEFVVIVVGVLVALGVDQWRHSVSDRAAEVEYLERLLNDLEQDSATVALDLTQGSAKVLNLERTLLNLHEPDFVRSRPTAAWPDLARTYARPDLQTTTFDELRSIGGLSLIRDEHLRFQIGDYYRRASVQFDERLNARRTSLATLVARTFPTVADAPDIASRENLDSEWASRRDSAFFASPHAEERMTDLLGAEYFGLVSAELEYARSIQRIDGTVLPMALDLMKSIRAYQERADG